MLTKELFEKAIAFAKARNESRGDAQASSAEYERSLLKNGEVILKNKPLSGWRFGEVELTRVSINQIV